MLRWLVTSVFAVLVLGAWCSGAEAARNFVATQSPAPNTPVNMGTTGSLTYQIANQNTGGNTGERIYEVRFRMSAGLSTFSSTTAAPAGWTRTGYSTTSVTFRATSWANAIPTGSSLNFVIAFNFRATTADTTESLRDIRARFTNSTSGPPFTNLGTDTDSNQGGWTLKALAMTLQITDLTGTPISTLNAGDSFRLVMTVTNRSTATQSSIVSVNNPPSKVTVSGNVTTNLTSTVYSPSPLTLAPGASGTITFTFSTSSALPGNSGEIYFQAYARNNSGNATSMTGVSPTLSVGLFNANITLSSTCVYNGSNITVRMTLTNNYTYNIINVVPTLTPSPGAPVSLVSGPTQQSSPATVPANGGTFWFEWVYVRTSATPGGTFSFSGSATGTGQTGGNPSRTTPTNTSSPITIAGYTITVDETNALSTNSEISWNVNNQGCSPIASIAFTIPAGWTWSGDSYSLVDTSATTSVENWTVSGSGPVTFTAPTLGDQLYLTGDGEYRLVFSATPTTAVPSTFTLTITHASGVVNTRQVNVTVNSYNFNNLNDANGRTWREEVR